MQDSFQNNERFIGEIENLYKLHHITKKYNHIIEYEPGSWKLFEPSKFIYAFFAFNSFYNFDWEQSLKNKQLCLFEMKTVDGGEQAVSESFKYKAMVDFIFKHITESDQQLFLKLIKGNEKVDSMLNAISSITPDARITDSEREKFKAAFEKLITTNEIKVGKLKNDILRFVYLVRNNIFHGTKNTIEMTESFQRKRLLIYTNILIAVNELLFKALEQTIEFKPHSNYHLSPK